MTRAQNRLLSAPTCLVLALLLLGVATLPAPALAADASLATKLQPFVDSNTLAGAVTLVASKDKVLDVGAVGFADIAARKPMRADCMFWIASMSKPITGAGVMILVDEGKIKLDDPIVKYLPEFGEQMVRPGKDNPQGPPAKPVHPITVRECLSHTSGLPFMAPKAGNKVDLISLRETVLAGAAGPLNSQPGTKYDYSNAGIDTAGLIIEIASGMPYEEFMQKRLFDPLGMKDTTMWPSEEQVARLAKCYRPGPNGKGLAETKVGYLSYPLTDRKRGVSPGGGLFATAADVAAFGQMVLGGGMYNGKRILSEAAVREMTSTQTGKLIDKDKGESGYGLGFSTTRRSAGATAPAAEPSPMGACGHGGACATDFWVDPQQGLVTVYMVQHQGYGGPDGGKILATLKKAANEALGKK